MLREQSNILSAQSQFNETKKAYEQYIATQPIRTNTAYVKIYWDLISLYDVAANQRQNIEVLRRTVVQSSISAGPTYVPAHIGRGDVGYYTQPDESARIGLHAATQTYLDNAETDLQNTYAAIDQDKQAMAKMYQDVNGSQLAQVQDAEASLSESQRNLETTASTLSSERLRLQTIKKDPPAAQRPTVNDILSHFMPPIAVETETDANENFTLSYPSNKKYVLFAITERATLSKAEKYIWLINAPSTGKAASILLDNNNLVEIDPDGYLIDWTRLQVTH